jgi:hypothetical protein
LFWTAAIDTQDVQAEPGNGRARMDVRNLALQDSHDLVNAITFGPSVPGTASFQIEWSASRDKQSYHNEALQYDAHMVLNTALVRWRGETAAATYVSNPTPATQVTVYAEVGQMRNGVFFS